MQDKTVNDILKFIKQREDVTIVRDIVTFVDYDQRYTQGLLDALERVGFIQCKPKGTMKIITLTDKGIDFLKNN